MALKRFFLDQNPGTAATTANTGASVRNLAGGTHTLTAAAAAHGTTGLEIVTSATSQFSIMRFLSDASSKQYAFSIAFQYLGGGTGGAMAATVPLGGLRNDSNDTYAMKWQVQSDNVFRVTDQANAFIGTAAPVLTPGAFYLLDVLTGGGTGAQGTISVDLYAATTSTPGSVVFSGTALASWNSTTANLGTLAFLGLDVGCVNSNQAATFRYDDIQLDDGRTTKIGPYNPNANQAPTVTAPAVQNVAAGATVTVTFAESDDVGVTSRTTTFDYPTTGAPTITNPGSASSSFTAGPAGSLYIVRRRVTDAGDLFAEATVEVRVPSSGDLVPLDGYPVSGSWTAVGATGPAVLSDANDATYYESPALTATPSAQRVRLQPATARTDATYTPRLSKSDSGACVFTISLYEGATLRQSWSYTATQTATDVPCALTSATVSAITDWGNLYVEKSATT